MGLARQAAVCLLGDGHSADAFRRCLTSVLDHTPRNRIELRLTMGVSSSSLAYAVGLLCPDGACPGRQALPGGVERFDWTARDGLPVWAWASARRSATEELLRLAVHDVPLATEYAVYLSDSTPVEPGWWEALAPSFEQGIDCIGRPAWHPYRPGEVERLRTEPWYMGVPPARRDGAAGVATMCDGFLAVRAPRLREAPAALGVRLGEMAHQLGWSQARRPESVNACA